MRRTSKQHRKKLVKMFSGRLFFKLASLAFLNLILSRYERGWIETRGFKITGLDM